MFNEDCSAVSSEKVEQCILIHKKCRSDGNEPSFPKEKKSYTLIHLMFLLLAALESKVAIMHRYSFGIFHFGSILKWWHSLLLCVALSPYCPTEGIGNSWGWRVLKNQEMYEV